MKPFEYYNENPHTLTSISQYVRERTKELDEIPLTKADRDAMTKEIKEGASEVVKDMNSPYYEFRRERHEEFLRDCRNYLGYTWFTKEAQQLIENKASDESTYEGKYERIKDLLEFIHNFQQAQKQK